MGLFRRQKDLLAKQREELGLDRLEAPSPEAPRQLASEPPPRSELQKAWESQPEPPRWRGGRGVTVSSRRPRSGWGRFVGIPRVFFITVVAVSWALVRAGLTSGVAVIAAVIVALAAGALLGRSRVRVQTMRVSPRSPEIPPTDQPAAEEPGQPPG